MVNAKFLILVLVVTVGCKSPTAGLKPPPSQGNSDKKLSEDVRGFIDLVDQNGMVEGWSYSTTNSGSSLDIAVFIDGDKDSENQVGALTTSELRQDVNDTLGFPVVMDPISMPSRFRTAKSISSSLCPVILGLNSWVLHLHFSGCPKTQLLLRNRNPTQNLCGIPHAQRFAIGEVTSR